MAMPRCEFASSAIVLCLGLSAAGQGLLAESGPAAAELDGERLKRSVVRITAHKPRKVRDVGAGVVLAIGDRRVLVLTAYHVVAGADEIEVQFRDRAFEPYAATPRDRVSETLDVAVLDVAVERARETLSELPTLDLARSARLELGDRVYPLGHPLELSWHLSRDNTVEVLIHEGDDRQLRFTRGSIAKGNSGGPIFDARGALVGMVGRKHPIHGVAVKSDALLLLLEEWGIPTTHLVRLPDLGTLIVETLPTAARIRLDGEDRGPGRDAGMRFEDLAPGSHTLAVSKPPGYREAIRRVEVVGGETQRLIVELEPIASESTFLVAVTAVSEAAEPGLETATATLRGRLRRSGYTIIAREETDRSLRGADASARHPDADPRGIAAISQRLGAEVVLLARLHSEAQPAVGRFFSGRAVLDLQCFRASTGQVLAAETLRVGDGRQPGKLGPTALLARTEAAEAVAGMAVERVIELVIPQLQQPDPGSTP